MSAFGQVISVRVRSGMPLDVPDDLLPRHPKDSINNLREIDYVTLIEIELFY